MKKNGLTRYFVQRCLTELGGIADKHAARVIARACILLIGSTLLACGTAMRAATDKVAEVALSAAGIKMPENPNLARPTKLLKVRIEAAKDLNAGEDGQGLSAIIRFYKLKDRTAFLSTAYSAFGHPEKETQAFGVDLMEVKEFTLIPGQTLNVTEKMTGEMAYLGMVTLFHAPDPKRWRFAFPAIQTQSPDITVGVHACAMTATSLAPSGSALNDAALLSPVRCQ